MSKSFELRNVTELNIITSLRKQKKNIEYTQFLYKDINAQPSVSNQYF